MQYECLSFPAPQETGSALSAENAQTINYMVSLLQKPAFVNEDFSICSPIIRHLEQSHAKMFFALLKRVYRRSEICGTLFLITKVGIGIVKQNQLYKSSYIIYA